MAINEGAEHMGAVEFPGGERRKGLHNVEHYAEWAEWCAYDSERRAAGPWWWLLFWEAVGNVVCEAIVAELDNR